MNKAIAEDDRCNDVRLGTHPEEIKQAVLDNLYYNLAQHPVIAQPRDWFMAVAYTVRDHMLGKWMKTLDRIVDGENRRIVAYLSAEFLIGPQLGANLLDLDLLEPMRHALALLGQDLDEIIMQENEPGLGNGGLGRLAACFMDSMATLDVLAVGYGIYYEFGMFRQQIQDGRQVEMADKWLAQGNPWGMHRHDIHYDVAFEGTTEAYTTDDGAVRVRWNPGGKIRGVAMDIPVVGYRSETCDILRLWRSEAVEGLDFEAFNQGDYFGAVQDKVISETLSKILYPNDEPEIGKRLRLAQQYFFVSCSLQDMIRMQKALEKPLEAFHEQFTIQLNDTHPSIAVAELMRLFVDEYDMDWDTAWNTTTKTFCYTNHTLLPEALERWAIPLFAQMLPRHLEIIYEINRRFLEVVADMAPGDEELVKRLSLIDETGPRYIRMAHLAFVGSRAVNGVAALHSELVKTDVLRDFYALWPKKFYNVTNGVTPRRWVGQSNPGLSDLFADTLGTDCLKCLESSLPKLETLVEKEQFRMAWHAVKQENKILLADAVKQRTGADINPDSMLQVLVKRIHEYKRQHLSALHAITLYNAIKRDPGRDWTPRTILYGGKAAPGYYMAKLIIQLINAVADVVDNDPDVDGRLKLVFVPNFNVKNGQMIYPAADVSLQISMAGKEASGTGNMKFTLNGALTLGTLDGANVEIRERVGAENFFLFGHTTNEVKDIKRHGYNPRAIAESDPVIMEALDQIAGGVFSKGDKDVFRPLVDNLLYQDDYLVLADFDSFAKAQNDVVNAWADQDHWTRMSILNVARAGFFSSDRSIRDYCRDIWNITV
ncbi:glycogen/starch/alpha-glucan phosphorylase [Desulfovibrio inopinatus]|uniref:glycogen/starch/alpha-glucan phosphorylase n=1 Tax=Desulfovibrio inopinatus TaxID=102109 RepID=UPI00040006B4|nr:glycogen/starch/alpha-glucan phosphorylase [Desulfovibrio inopinatus]